MSVRVVGLVTVNEEAASALAAYLRAVLPLLDAAGARIEQRFTVNEVVVGPRPATLVMILEFPDREAVDALFGSPAYKALTALRQEAFQSYQVSVVTDQSPIAEAE